MTSPLTHYGNYSFVRHTVKMDLDDFQFECLNLNPNPKRYLMATDPLILMVLAKEEQSGGLALYDMYP